MAKRFIDADELELEYYGLSIHGTIAVKSVLPIFADLLEKQPTADVVEVVRCRDCRYFTEGMAVGMCKRIEDKPIIPCRFDHFCSYGEKERR